MPSKTPKSIIENKAAEKTPTIAVAVFGDAELIFSIVGERLIDGACADRLILFVVDDCLRDGFTEGAVEYLSRGYYVATFLEALDGLDEKKVATFTVFTALPGTLTDVLTAKIAELGAEVVVSYAYWRIKPDAGEHMIPAECMVRIR